MAPLLASRLRFAKETEQGIAEEVNGSGCGNQGEDGAVEENSCRSLVEDGGEEIIGACGEENADERKQVRCGYYAAFLLGERTMLDQSVQWYGEEAAKKAEQAEIRDAQAYCGHDELAEFYGCAAALVERSGAEPMREEFGGLAEVKQGPEDRHAERADGNQG